MNAHFIELLYKLNKIPPLNFVQWDLSSLTFFDLAENDHMTRHTTYRKNDNLEKSWEPFGN